MPYLKIRTAYGTNNDWTTINDLTLDKATISNATIISVDNETSPTSKIVIAEGKLKIGIGSEQKNLDEYLNLNSSGCTVGSINGEEPGGYDWPASGKTPKKGDLFIQLKTEGEGNEATVYSLLWYCNEKIEDGKTVIYWTRVNAIWG